MSDIWFRRGGESGHNVWMEGSELPEGGVQIGCMFDPAHTDMVVDALNRRNNTVVIATVGPTCDSCGGSMLIPEKVNNDQVSQ